ncbi:hypothetical protein NOCA2370053 [metagenome]|uniref:Uncharacterized protein n=1 Tax=metagenome TaxID=256318 RepID=A0A2P2C4L6_9ZZZZ
MVHGCARTKQTHRTQQFIVPGKVPALRAKRRGTTRCPRLTNWSARAARTRCPRARRLP